MPIVYTFACFFYVIPIFRTMTGVELHKTPRTKPSFRP